ncbi:hypothetical protein DFH06DRAFT_1366309 [Mycena polygramma]|nr:hypothetical protein DFH06DRAFT_1366309 [Mycena polygramma]
MTLCHTIFLPQHPPAAAAPAFDLRAYAFTLSFHYHRISLSPLLPQSYTAAATDTTDTDFNHSLRQSFVFLTSPAAPSIPAATVVGSEQFISFFPPSPAAPQNLAIISRWRRWRWRRVMFWLGSRHQNLESSFGVPANKTSMTPPISALPNSSTLSVPSKFQLQIWNSRERADLPPASNSTRHRCDSPAISIQAMDFPPRASRSSVSSCSFATNTLLNPQLQDFLKLNHLGVDLERTLFIQYLKSPDSQVPIHVRHLQFGFEILSPFLKNSKSRVQPTCAIRSHRKIQPRPKFPRPQVQFPRYKYCNFLVFLSTPYTKPCLPRLTTTFGTGKLCSNEMGPKDPQKFNPGRSASLRKRDGFPHPSTRTNREPYPLKPSSNSISLPLCYSVKCVHRILWISKYILQQSKHRLSGPESQTSKQRTSLVIRAGSRYHYRTSTSENWGWALGLWISDGPQDQELLESNVPFARRPILLCLDPVLASVSQTAWTKMAIWMTDLRRRVPAGARGRGDQEEGRSPQFTAPGGDSEPDSDSCTDQEMPAAGCPTATRRSSASPGTINCGALMDAYSASVSDSD